MHLPMICTHLDHICEEMRQAQLNLLLEEISNRGISDDFLLCGDLNALHKSDYSIREWRVIKETRALSNWEPPRYSLMRNLIQHHRFVDAFRESQGLNHNAEVEGIATTSRYCAKLKEIL